MAMNASKNGQAMVELLVGLVGILVLILGLSQISTLVANDFDSMFGAREDAAEKLLASSTSHAAGSYNPSASYLELDMNVNVTAGGAYARFIEAYPQGDRIDGFEFLRSGSDPLSSMSGAKGGHSVEIESQLMREVLGRSAILMNHEVWMPPWDELQ